MINSEILNSLSDANKRQYDEYGSVTIYNFLEQEHAEALETHLGKIPNYRWHGAYFPDGAGLAAKVTCVPENDDSAIMHLDLARKAMREGGFSYHFYRTTDDHARCGCAECNFREWIVSQSANSFFSGITGRTYDTANGMFVSRYDPGCFLTPHTDPDHGDIGFVYNLTRDWNPQWGGLLHFMSSDGTIGKVCVPVFNSMTIFNISSGGQSHYVSEVVAGLGRSRYAVTGWLS